MPTHCLTTLWITRHSFGFASGPRRRQEHDSSGSSTPTSYKNDSMVGMRIDHTPLRLTLDSDVYSVGISEFLRGAAPSQVLADLERGIDMRAATCIGKGSMADVLCTRRKQDGQQVAIKVVDDSEANRLRSEVESLKAVGEHPNLVRFLGLLKGTQPLPNSSKAPPCICLVMAYVPSAAVLSRYIRAGRSSEAFAAKTGQNVASGLSHMHIRGFVHHDVWSENILIDRSGIAVLCDFGCACRVGSSTQYGLNLPYISPELWAGDVACFSDDAWSLALVLAEIATGIFVKDRIGGTGKPAHTNHGAFAKMIVETKRAQSGLGMLCERILLSSIDMLEIESDLVALGASDSIPSLSHSGSQLRVDQTPMPQSARNGLVSSLGHLPHNLSSRVLQTVAQRSASFGPADCLSVGQRVEYCAKSNSVWYVGTLFARNGGSWLVQLDVGPQKEVLDHETSTRLRLKHDEEALDEWNVKLCR